jgi:hypothetical protein
MYDKPWDKTVIRGPIILVGLTTHVCYRHIVCTHAVARLVADAPNLRDLVSGLALALRDARPIRSACTVLRSIGPSRSCLYVVSRDGDVSITGRRIDGESIRHQRRRGECALADSVHGAAGYADVRRGLGLVVRGKRVHR